LSDLGGFLEIIVFITGVIVYYNQKFYFEQTLVRELFMENIHGYDGNSSMTKSIKEQKTYND